MTYNIDYVKGKQAGLTVAKDLITNYKGVATAEQEIILNGIINSIEIRRKALDNDIDMILERVEREYKKC